MNYLYIGKLVNTHGIKGEVRILSNFIHKDKVLNSMLVKIRKSMLLKHIGNIKTLIW